MGVYKKTINLGNTNHPNIPVNAHSCIKSLHTNTSDTVFFIIFLRKVNIKVMHFGLASVQGSTHLDIITKNKILFCFFFT